MKRRNIFLLAVGARTLIVLMVIALIGAHYVFSALWFEPMATVEEVTRALRAGNQNINEFDDNGQTGLMRSIALSNCPLFQTLLLFGADPNLKSQDEEGKTALHYAIFAGDAQDLVCLDGREGHDSDLFVETLLRYGAEPNVRDVMTDPNVPQTREEMPIHFLRFVQNQDKRERMLQMLLDYGADINAQNGAGYTLLHIAADENDGTWVDRLKARFGSLLNFNIKANVLTVTTGQYASLTPAELAYVNGNRFLADNLVDVPVAIGIENVAERDAFERTGMMLAIMRNDYEFVRTQIERAADVDAKDNVGNVPLHYAALNRFNPLAFLRILLDNNALINIPNNNGDTALHLAVMIKNDNERREAVDLLLSRGADAKIQNKNGDTPLHIAVRNNYVNLIKRLNVPNSDLSNKEGVTPFALAQQLGRRDAAAAFGS